MRGLLEILVTIEKSLWAEFEQLPRDTDKEKEIFRLKAQGWAEIYGLISDIKNRRDFINRGRR